jgi:Protein of unknown function (DUF3109)
VFSELVLTGICGRPKRQMEANKAAHLTLLAERWLRDFNEAPWRRYLRSLEKCGLLAKVDGIMVDAGTIFKTHFRCDTRTCAGIDRGPGIESCCTDYDVEITPEEHARILENGDAVIELLRRHDGERVTPERTIGEFFLESHTISLAKEKGRCAFSYRDAGGQLRCGIHSLALEKGVPVPSIKPLACVLFPIVIYRFENGETLLTATSRETSSLFGREKDSELPCLRAEQGDPMFVECRMAIEAGFGEAFYQRLMLAASEFTQPGRRPA